MLFLLAACLLLGMSAHVHASSKVVCRVTVQEYDTTSVYTAGNLLREYVADGNGTKYTETAVDPPVVGLIFLRDGLFSRSNGVINNGQHPVFETLPDRESGEQSIMHNNSVYAITDYSYDSHSNLRTVTLPGNVRGQIMNYYCKYDSVGMDMYPVEVTDSRTFTSTSSNIDYRYSLTRQRRDIHEIQTYMYTDNLGHVTGYNAPRELSAIGTERIHEPPYYTISFEYEPMVAIDPATGYIMRPAYAVTRHLNSRDEDNVDHIETITFVDGFGRPVQVQWESEVENQAQTTCSWSAACSAATRSAALWSPTI